MSVCQGRAIIDLVSAAVGWRLGVGSGYWLGLQERGIVELVCQGGAITAFFGGGGGVDEEGAEGAVVGLVLKERPIVGPVCQGRAITDLYFKKKKKKKGGGGGGVGGGGATGRWSSCWLGLPGEGVCRPTLPSGAG